MILIIEYCYIIRIISRDILNNKSSAIITNTVKKLHDINNWTNSTDSCYQRNIRSFVSYGIRGKPQYSPESRARPFLTLDTDASFKEKKDRVRACEKI